MDKSSGFSYLQNVMKKFATKMKYKINLTHKMKILCIGRNYIKHINELKNVVPTEPLFFLKPEAAIQPKNHPFLFLTSQKHSI